MIVCELVAGEKATAHVVYLGDVNGKILERYLKLIHFNFGCVKAIRMQDFIFYILQMELWKTKGIFTFSRLETYTLSGFAKYSLGESEPKITIPKPITLDTIKILDTKFTTNNVFVTHLDLIYENYSKKIFIFNDGSIQWSKMEFYHRYQQIRWSKPNQIHQGKEWSLD